MKWFKHDTDALQDAKIRKLIIKYGVTGYAIYFHCLELIAGNIDENNLTFELEHDSEIIADDLHISGTQDKSGQQVVEEIMRYIIHLNLFEESQGRIFCFKMLIRLDASMSSNKKFRDFISEAKHNHDCIMTYHDSIMQDIDTDKDIEKESEEKADVHLVDIDKPKNDKTSKVKPEYSEDFLKFYMSYPRQEGKKQAQKTFNALVKKGISLDTILSALEVYKEQIKARNTALEYIKLPSTFLNCLDDYTPKISEKSEDKKQRIVFRRGLMCPICGAELPAGGDVCLKCGAGRMNALEDMPEYFEVQHG